MPPTSWEHGLTTNRLQHVLNLHVKAHDLGEIAPAETGFNLTQPGELEETVLAADIAFVQADRVPQRHTETFARLAPNLVVEIASKGQYRPGMDAKARLWLERGVQLVWIVWPARQIIDVWQPGDQVPHVALGIDDVLDGGDVVPGFTCPVAEVFR
jgi:Uma2 family endonuclease